jgi:NADPH:quinone reductase-like Zn-dependent oxidoreductase
MQALYIDQYGEPNDNIKLGALPVPKPGDGQVLIRVRAAALNPVDWLITRGFMQAVANVPFPWVPGHDVAGVVAAVGPGVNHVQVGKGSHSCIRLL